MWLECSVGDDRESPPQSLTTSVNNPARQRRLTSIQDATKDSAAGTVTSSIQNVVKESARMVTSSVQDTTKDSAAGTVADEPRCMRFTWSMKTTSSLQPDAIITHVCSVLVAHGCRYRRHAYTLTCWYGDENCSAESYVQWEMEVCRLPRLSLNGVRLRRVAGSAISFKNIAARITNDLRL